MTASSANTAGKSLPVIKPSRNTAKQVGLFAVLTAAQTPDTNVIGMTMRLQFVVLFSFILLVNAPHKMITQDIDTFDARGLIKAQLVITLATTVLLVIFALRTGDGWHTSQPRAKRQMTGNVQWTGL